MPRTDAGLPLLALIAAASWIAAAAAALADLAAVAVVLAIAPAAVGAYRDRRLGPGLAVAGAAIYGLASAWAGASLLSVGLGALGAAGLGLLVAATIGTAADEAATYRVWYHGLRDRLPAATLFFMPETGRVHDLNDRAADLLGPLRTRSLAEAFADPDAYDAFAAEVAAGEAVHRGAWLRGADGADRWCELASAMATPVLAVVSVDDRTAERTVADALAASEAAHRTLVAHAPGATLLVDDDFRIAAAGGEALEALAGRDEPVAGRTLWTAFPDRVAQALEPLARLAVFGAPGTGELEAGGRRFLLAAAPVPGDGGTVTGAAIAATDATALFGRLGECEERRSLANALLAVHRAEGTDAADRLLAAALRATGSRYGAVLRVDDDALVPLAVSPALADADLAVLAGDVADSGEPAAREARPDAPLPLRRILAVPVGKGVVAVADRSALYTDREVALVRALADEGFAAAARSAAGAETAARADAFEALLAAVPLPLVVAGPDGRVRYENEAAHALFGEAAPDSLGLRIAGPDRNRVATTEERRRRGARGVPTRYRAAVLDANGAERPCLVAAVYRKPETAALLAFLDLGPAARFDACRDRAVGVLEARLEGALGAAGDDPAAFAEAVRAAWRASIRERNVLAAPTPFEALPDCDYS
ncbi:MAG: PAS domain-containing protein [Methanospirillum sp.]